MTCTRCGVLVVMVRRHPDCTCNPAPAELIAAERARLASGGKLIVRSGSFYKLGDTWTTTRANAQAYDEPPPRGPDAEPWDVEDA